MKILHVITSLRIGGAEKLIVDLLTSLKNFGFDVELCIFNGEQTSLYRDIIQKGINVIDFGVGNSEYSIKNIYRLYNLIKKYDIIHTHNTSPQFFTAIAAIGQNIRLVTTEHGGSNRRRKYKLFSVLDYFMYRQYEKVICISEKTLLNLDVFTGNKLNNLIVVNNGIDIHKFVCAKQSSELEAIAPGSKKIMMVAGFRWEKDQDTLISALTHLPNEFHLFLVGDGVRRQELEKLSSDKGISARVHFLGVRSDVPELLHAADYIVMSSHFEGLSLSSVEGMSVGKPFLASDVDGLREVVEGAGILFPHQDAQALAEEILNLENSPELYRSVANACYNRARQFDISKMVEGYSNIYKSLQ